MDADLAEIKADCSEGNWDSYDAMPVTQEALNTAGYLLDSIPWLGGRPDPTPINDGGIDLSFNRADYCINSRGDWYVYRFGIIPPSTERNGE